MTVEQKTTSGAYEQPPPSFSPKPLEITPLNPDESLYNRLRNIIPKLPGWIGAIRSSANGELSVGTFNFDIRHPVGNYSFHAVLEDSGNNGGRKRKLTAELSFSLSFDNTGPFVKESVTVSPEDKSERKYHYGESDRKESDEDLGDDEALPKMQGFVRILGSLVGK